MKEYNGDERFLMKISILNNYSVIKGEKILVIGDDYDTISQVKSLLISENFKFIITEPQKDTAAVVFCDSGDSHVAYEAVKSRFVDTPIIVISSKDDVEYIVGALKDGVYDFLHKTQVNQRLLLVLARAVERSILVRALSRNAKISGRVKNPEHFAHIITQDELMIDIFVYLEQIADSVVYPVLITGETGVGKELVAKAVHNVSCRKEFIALNIAGIDNVTFSDTLFGHTRGAFTGADSYRDGMLSKVKDGILFLDEIGDLSEHNQLKLLRLIQEREYYKLGSDVPQEFRGRIVLATNKDLEKMVKENKFRKDLYFRISGHHVNVPALRERQGDVPLLLKYFVDKSAKLMDKPEPKISPKVIDMIAKYEFPGNVRELEAMVYDVVAQHRFGIISPKAFYDKMDHKSVSLSSSKYEFGFDRFPTLKEIADSVVERAMKLSNNNQSVAASLLGITRQALNKRLKNKIVN